MFVMVISSNSNMNEDQENMLLTKTCMIFITFPRLEMETEVNSEMDYWCEQFGGLGEKIENLT